MSLEREEVLKIAHLARLKVGDDELERYIAELGEILSLVDRMNQANTTNVEPMAHPLDSVQRLRADEITETNQRERLQSGAPAVRDGFYLVPRVIE